MSAIAQPVSTTAARPERKPSGWSQLKLLLPYVFHYKRMVAVGLLALALTGLVGALPQLIIGAITDCLQASPLPLSTLSGTARALLHPLFAFYAPMSRHAVGLYCIILVVVMLVKGFFSFWTRWILIGVSREIEYDLRNDLLDSASRPRSGVLLAKSHRRSDVAGHQRSKRRAHGSGARDHVHGEHDRHQVLAVYFMTKLSVPSNVVGSCCPCPSCVVSVWYFGQIIHRLSEQIQAALGVLSTRAQENLTGVRVIRAYVQEKPEIESFDRANGTTWTRISSSSVQLEPLLPRSGGADRLDDRDFARHGRRRGRRSSRFPGYVSGVLFVLDPACFPDDRDRLRDEYFPAGSGFDGPAELHFECPAKHSGRRLLPRTKRRRAPPAETAGAMSSAL